MKYFSLAISLSAASFLSTALAASEDECAIWICLPGAFPVGCGAAKSAMVDRVKKSRPPLPHFISCAENPPKGSGSHMTFSHGIAAYIDTHRVCIDHNNEDCSRWKTVPAHYIRGKRCRIDDKGRSTPPYCTRTDNWAEVYVENILIGSTFYWHER